MLIAAAAIISVGFGGDRHGQGAGPSGTVEVYPTGRPADDFKAIDDAVNVTVGVQTVILKATSEAGNLTAFRLDTGLTSAHRSIALTRPIRIRGESVGAMRPFHVVDDDGQEVTVMADRTVIYGGVNVFTAAAGASTFDYSIKKLWFDSFWASAMSFSGGRKITIANNVARHFSVGVPSPAGLANVNVLSISGGASGRNITGDINVEGNDFSSDLTRRDQDLGDASGSTRAIIRKRAILVNAVQTQTPPPVVKVIGNIATGHFQWSRGGAVTIQNCSGTIFVSDNAISVHLIPEEAQLRMDALGPALGYFQNGLQVGHTSGGGEYHVDHNVISVPALGDGIIFVGNAPAPHSTLSYNTIQMSDSWIGISMVGLNDSTAIIENTITGFGRGGVGSEEGGIPSSAIRMQITNNHLFGFHSRDVSAYYDPTVFPAFAQVYFSTRTTLSESDISDNELGSGATGVWLGDSHGNQVLRNTILEASRAHVMLEGSSNNTVAGNWFLAFTGSADAVPLSAPVSIVGLRIPDKETQESTGNTFRENDYSGTGVTGWSISESSGVSLGDIFLDRFTADNTVEETTFTPPSTACGQVLDCTIATTGASANTIATAGCDAEQLGEIAASFAQYCGAATP